MSTNVVTEDGERGAARGAAASPLASAWARTRNFRPVLFLVIALFAFFSMTQGSFLNEANVKNLLTGIAILWVVSMGMTFVTIVGGFDLSVGAVAALSGIFVARLLGAGVPDGVAVVLAIVLGALIGGLFNGYMIGRLGLSFFVVTLATMTALTGVVNLWSGTHSEVVTSPLISRIGVEETLGLPTAIWIMIVIFLVAIFVQHRTYFGRDVYAVGGSLTAARLSGIPAVRTIVIVYAAVGACAALGGVIAVGRVGAASAQVNVDLPLQAAAAVLLGGTALAGGLGGVGGTALGVLFIGILQNGLSIAGVQSFWQQVVTGLILMGAVLGDRISARGGVRRQLRTRRAQTVSHP